MIKNVVKENNGGGLQIERYVDGKIEQVVSGLEFADQGRGEEDIVGFGRTWDYTDAEGECVGFCVGGNTAWAVDAEGKAITAETAVDEYAETVIIAEYDGETLTVYADRMGRAGLEYFGATRN